MQPHFNGCQPIANARRVFSSECLGMQEKVAAIERWLQTSGKESARVVLGNFRNKKIACLAVIAGDLL